MTTESFETIRQILKELSAYSTDTLKDLVEIQFLFKECAPRESIRSFHLRRHLAQKLLELRSEKASQPGSSASSNDLTEQDIRDIHTWMQTPHLAVLGHEMAHEMRANNPALYDRMVEAIRPYVKQKEYGQWALNDIVASKEASFDKKREEFMGEVLSDGFMDPVFWQALGKKINNCWCRCRISWRACCRRLQPQLAIPARLKPI